MATGFLRLALDDSALGYLQRISAGAPMEFNMNPLVYLSDPRHPLNFEDVEDVLGGPTRITFDAGRTLHSPASSLPEFCILCRPDDTLAHFFPKAVGEFIPYFVWAVSVNRSRSTRSFSISMLNSMQADAVSLTGTIHWEPSDGNMAALFNEFTQDPNAIHP